MKAMKRAIRFAFALIGVAAGTGAGLFAYYFAQTEIPEGELSSWQKDLADSRAMNTVYLPGSHDSLANYAMGDLSGKCQDLRLSSQLNAGSRFFDLRYKIDGSKLKSYHGIVDQRTYFSDDVKIIESFLKNHPSEFLFISVKEEVGKTQDGSFETALRSCVDESIWNISENLPQTVGEARGKAHLISRYYAPTIGFKAPPNLWADNATFDLDQIHVQDNYKLTDTKQKKDFIEAGFADSGKLNIHFFSGYLSPGFPPSSAINVARDINPWVKEALDKPNSNGIIVLDFLTTALSQEIIGRNKA